MATNMSAEDGMTDNPETETEARKDEKDLKRGRLLMWLLIGALVILGGLYIFAHYVKPNGLFAPTAAASALEAIQEANTSLKAAEQDVLQAEMVARLTSLSKSLALLTPQLGAEPEYTDLLDQVNAELDDEEANRAVLSLLFAQLEDMIDVGPCSYFWRGCLDRWFELVFWTLIGTMVFLLNEIKKYYPQPYKKNRDFTRYTPWYIANAFRGPFIASVILLALSSITIDAIGVTIDIKTAPIEVLIALAAILGYYSRLADQQLDIITEKIFGAAWNKVNLPDKSSSPQDDDTHTPTTSTEEPGESATTEQPIEPSSTEKPA